MTTVVFWKGTLKVVSQEAEAERLTEGVSEIFTKSCKEISLGPEKEVIVIWLSHSSG